MDRIRKNHPDLKGSFVSIGCWFNLFNKESMEDFNAMLESKVLTKKDVRTAKEEHRLAVLAAEKWQRQPELWFLYDAANEQGDWSVKF